MPRDLMGDEKDRQERDEEVLALAHRKVCEVFDALGIPYKIFFHPPIFSAAEREEKQVEVDGLICKNLFLRNKDKSRYYLYTLPIDKRADLAGLQKALGETRLSFGDADALWDMLHIHPGSVSLLNIIGAASPLCEPSFLSVKFLVDAEVLDVPGIGVHPNDNGATIVFSPDRLPEIFARYGADFEFISLCDSADNNTV